MAFNYEKAIIRFLALSMIVLFLISILKESIKEDELSSDYSITNGTIIDYEGGVKSAFRLKYSFKVNGVLYYGHNIYPKYTANFVNKTFPVAYKRTDVGNNKMLVVPDNFKELHIPFPDSLLWTEKFH